MKKIIAILCLTLMTTTSFAAIKCAPDNKGGQCCWDTDKEGSFKPLGC